MIPKAAFTFESSLSFCLSILNTHTHTHTHTHTCLLCQLVTHQKPFPDTLPHQPTTLSASRSEHLKHTLNQDGPWPRPHCELPGKGAGFRPSLALVCDLLHPRTHVREACTHRQTFSQDLESRASPGATGTTLPCKAQGAFPNARVSRKGFLWSGAA